MAVQAVAVQAVAVQAVAVRATESGARTQREAGELVARPRPGPARGEAERWWVDARPFRAHLRHLMAVGSLDAAEVAVVLGLSTSAVQHLLEGRAGRATRRISPLTARRLLLVGDDDVRGLRWRLAPTTLARASLRRLHESGWTSAEVATAVGFRIDELAGVEDRPHCNRLLAVRLVGLARLLPGTLDDEDLVDVAEAA